MAHIKINSKIVIGACEDAKHKAIRVGGINEYKRIAYLNKIQRLAEYSPSEDIYLNHDDFSVISDHMPNPATYSQDKP